MSALISVIIPVKNGEQTLDACLSAICKQTVFSQLEIIIIDSASTDNSKKIASNYDVKWIEIPATSFNHGSTRNMGAKIAKGELIWFSVQDAFIAEENMLEKMAAHFQNKEIVSVTGMQAIPHHIDKNPALWLRRSSEPEVEIFKFEANQFKLMSSSEQMKFCRWDNVNSMYRRSALIDMPFETVTLSEDILWARAALSKGMTIIRDPSLLVWHYHHHYFSYNFRVNYAVFFTDKMHFNILPKYPKLLMPFLKRANTIRKNTGLSFSSKAKWIIHNAGMLAAHFCSVTVFRFNNLMGSQSLRRSYEKICKVIPQGKQSVSK